MGHIVVDRNCEGRSQATNELAWLYGSGGSGAQASAWQMTIAEFMVAKYPEAIVHHLVPSFTFSEAFCLGYAHRAYGLNII